MQQLVQQSRLLRAEELSDLRQHAPSLASFGLVPCVFIQRNVKKTENGPTIPQLGNPF